MSYKKRFEENLINNSISNNVKEALLEWDYVDNYYDDYSDECICGKQHIKEICVVKNKINDKVLHIGNECINKFFDDYIVNTSKSKSRFNKRLIDKLVNYLKPDFNPKQPGLSDFKLYYNYSDELLRRGYIDRSDLSKINKYDDIENYTYYYYLKSKRSELIQIIKDYIKILDKIYKQAYKVFNVEHIDKKIRKYHKYKIDKSDELFSKSYYSLIKEEKLIYIDTLMINILMSDKKQFHKRTEDIRYKTILAGKLPTDKQTSLIIKLHKQVEYKKY